MTCACSLHLDDDGLVWLDPADEGPGRCLGPAWDELFDDVPQHLWIALARLLAEAEDARRYGRACRAEQEDTYHRQTGAR